MAFAGEKQYCDLLTPVVCDGCGGQNDVINYCLQCPGNICNECISTHCNTRLTSDHIVLHRTHPEVVKARRSKKIYCAHHKGKEYVTYCTSCDFPCCATCIVENHKGHEFSDLESRISKTEAEVDNLVHELENDLIPLSELAISAIRSEITAYKESMEEVKKLSKDRLEELIQQLVRTKENVLADVDERGEKDLCIMETKQKELEKNLETVKSAIAKGKTAPVDASLLLIKDELTKMKCLRPNQIAFPGKLALQTSSFQLPSAVDIVGKINNGTENIILNTPVQIQHCITQQKSTRELKIVKKIDGIQRYTISHNKDKQMLVCDFVGNVRIFTERFAKVKTIKLGFICLDIAVFDSKEIVASKYPDCTYHMSSSGKYIKTIAEPCLCTTGGVCVNDKQEVVIGVGNGIQVFSSDGSCLKDIWRDDEGKCIFSNNIKRVRQTRSGEYVAADEGGNIIYLSTEWKVKWTYDFGTSTQVIAFCCDENNNVIVGDKNKNEIVMLNKDGKLIQTLLTETNGISDPLSLDIDCKGRLWIGQEKIVLVSSYVK